MKKTILIGFILISVLMISCTPTGRVVQEQTTIGAIMPLTGELALLGQEMQRGMEIAAKEENIKLIIEDDGLFDARLAINGANKLLAQQVDATIIGFVNDAVYIAPIHEENEVPLVVLYDSNENLHGLDYTFSIGYSTELVGKQMAKYSIEELEIKTLCLIDHIDPWAEVIGKAFVKEFISLGGEIICHQTHAPNDQDYKTSILKATKADAIYAALIPPKNAEFFSQTKELGYKGKILTGDALIDDLLGLPGTEGIIYTNIYEAKTSKGGQLSEKYKEKYGEESPSPAHVQMGYDAIKVLSHAKKQEGNFYENFKTTKDLEVAGPSITFDEEGMANREEKIFQVINGKSVLVEE